VKWCSIKVSVQFSLINSLRYLTVSSVCAVFVTATWLSFRCWPTLINQFTNCFHWAKLPTIFRKFCNNCSVSKTKSLQCLDPSFTFVRYYRPNCDYDLKYCHCYVAYKHKIMTSQQRWYGTCCSVTLVIKSTFCSVVKFVLEVCVSVNLTYVK